MLDPNHKPLGSSIPCESCGVSIKKVSGLTKHCGGCRKAGRAKRIAERKAKLKAAGLCVMCGKPAKPNPDGGTFNNCEYHSRKSMLSARKSLQKGGSRYERFFGSEPAMRKAQTAGLDKRESSQLGDGSFPRRRSIERTGSARIDGLATKDVLCFKWQKGITPRATTVFHS